uniref:Beta-1,4-glucuronyltransferase 1 n=1 Tax=Geospiza parvula TaxID=87175 RepID=A0A8U8C925_GEOPR
NPVQPMTRARFLGGCAWLLGALALLQTLYLRSLPPPAHPPPPIPPPPGRAAAALGGARGGSWAGPLSLAAFGEPRAGLRELLAALGGPCRALRGRLRLHVVQGAARPPPRVPPPQSPPQNWPGGCRGALARLAAADPPSYALGVPYPGNLLRNVAWQGAPSPGLREGFLELLDPHAQIAPHDPHDPHAPAPPWARTLFVLPAFEVRGSRPPPGSKAELLRLWGAGEARPFYGGLCPRCQAPTAFGRWRGLPPAPPGPPRLRVAYEVPWRDPWEPFFVAPARGVPPFDEGFLQYGFNRISQACELHVAGFRFAVLDGAFVTHRGWKEPGGFHAGREAELGRNRQRFREFKRGLKLKYPDSDRRC